MRYRLPALALLFTAVTLYAQASDATFRRDLLSGSWKVNREKSNLQNAQPASRLPALYREYKDNGDGFMLHTVIVVSPDGQSAELQLLGAVKYDNKEYPTYTQKRLTDFLATGKQALQTVSFKVVDAYKMDWTDRTSGKITADGTMTLSEDGKTMTMTDHSYDASGKPTNSSVLVYEKQ